MDGPLGGARHERLVGTLAFVKIDRLFAMAPVNVAKDVEFWLHAPDFLKEACAAEGKIAVEGLLCA